MPRQPPVVMPNCRHTPPSTPAQPAEQRGHWRGQQRTGAVTRQLLQADGCMRALTASLLIHPRGQGQFSGSHDPFWPLAKIFLLPELLFCVLFSPSLNHSLETRAGNPIHWALVTYQASFTVMSQTSFIL